MDRRRSSVGVRVSWAIVGEIITEQMFQCNDWDDYTQGKSGDCCLQV